MPRPPDTDAAARYGIRLDAMDSSSVRVAMLDQSGFIDASNARISPPRRCPCVPRARIVMERRRCCCQGRYTNGRGVSSPKLILTSRTTPMMSSGRSGFSTPGEATGRNDLPTGFCPGQNCRAAVSLTIAAGTLALVMTPYH